MRDARAGAPSYTSPTMLSQMAPEEDVAAEYVVQTPILNPKASNIETDLPAYVRVPVSPDGYKFSPLTRESIEANDFLENFSGIDFLNGNEKTVPSRKQQSSQWPPSPPLSTAPMTTGLGFENINTSPASMVPGRFHDVDQEAAIAGLYHEGLPLPGTWEAHSQALAGLISLSFGGNMVVDQSDWKVTCSPQLSTASPSFPIRPVRTSQSTLCTLSDAQF